MLTGTSNGSSLPLRLSGFARPGWFADISFDPFLAATMIADLLQSELLAKPLWGDW